jgi:hypothetical protein
MAIFFLKYSIGNGYRCGCCSRWTDLTETIHADNATELVARVEDEMRVHDYDDGITLGGLINGATGVDYSDYNEIYTDFDKLLGSLQVSNKERDAVRNVENEISAAQRKFAAEKAKYDEQLKDGLIAQKGYDKWVGLEQHNLDARLGVLRPQLERAKAAVTTRSSEEIRAAIIARIEAADKDRADDQC